eukprot:32294-Amphidinium_carterae.1
MELYSVVRSEEPVKTKLSTSHCQRSSSQRKRSTISRLMTQILQIYIVSLRYLADMNCFGRTCHAGFLA